MDTADKKIATFLDLLEERTIDSIDKDLKINESCTATLLLIFAVIDSLGKITCSEDQYKKKKGNDQIRFTNFLEKLMGPSYAKFKDRLYYLRCDIVHTAINTKVIMSKDKHAYHLVEVNGILRINTSRFLYDLKEAVRQIRKDTDPHGRYFRNATNRLKEFDIIGDADQDPTPSAAPNDKPFR